MSSLIPFTLEIDLFASRENAKLDKYASLSFDHNAFATDAFSFVWPSAIYAFQPIPLISKVVYKFFQDEVSSGLLITPAWPSIPFLYRITNALIANLIFMPYSYVIGCLPNAHPFNLMGWPISSDVVKTEAYRRMLPELSPGALKRVRSMPISGTGASLLAGLLKRGIEAIVLPL